MNPDRKETWRPQILFRARPKNPEGLHAKLIEEIADVCEPDHKTASCTASVELPHALLVRWTANVRRPVSPLRVVRMITILITAAARAAIAASLPKGALNDA